MKLVYLFSGTVILLILSLSLWNSSAVSKETAQLQQQLQTVDAYAQQESWPDAYSLLKDCYSSWTQHQTWLHMVAEHDLLNAAEAMYQRAMAFALAEEPSEFHAELADLQTQIRLLAEAERFSVENIF